MNCENYLFDDLGAVYTSDETRFRLWAPMADEVFLCLYETGDGDDLIKKVTMDKSEGGTWFSAQKGDLDKTYYTYVLKYPDYTVESYDPYAKACGVNGVRSMVIDLEKTNPEGFSNDKGPVYKEITDAIITEISVVDTTADKSACVKNAGKLLGLTEEGTVSREGMATGIDHLKELGVTHVQIMPSYDFASVDEASDEPQYNWGYDPLNYNIPEGSLSSDPYHGEVRIKEYKQMVKTFHDNGIGVIMDVVYNHTFNVDGNSFQKTAPDYFYRKDGDKYSDASACGNEIASERPMVRKYIIDSLCYWVNEYHIDGFRFDLMGVLDIETMNEARETLLKINPNIILYGEGWTGGDSVLPAEKRALKVNVKAMPGYGMFSDDIRDNVKGHVFYYDELGYANGGIDKENDIRFAVTGAVKHPQVDYEKYTYTKEGAWAVKPGNSINYVSCHDNYTLWDRYEILSKEDSKEELKKKNMLSAAIVFTAQGVPFFLQGEEFGRSKPIENSDERAENSYNMPLYTNSLKYDRLYEFRDMYEYYRGLIQIRKNHELFRLATVEDVVEKLNFIDCEEKNVVAYTLKDDNEQLFVVYNANKADVTLQLPKDGEWTVIAQGTQTNNAGLCTIKNQAEIPGISCLIAIKK